MVDLCQAKRRADQIIGERPVYRQLISAWMRILTLLEGCKPEADQRMGGLAEASAQAGKEGETIISWEGVVGDGELLSRLFVALAEEMAGSLNPGARSLADRWGDDRPGFRRMALSILSGEGVEASVDEDERALTTFLLHLSVRPLLQSLSSMMAGGGVWKGEWVKGVCPMCGSFPSLSVIGGEGEKRELYCSLCDLRWRFLRLSCPHCGNGDYRKLGHLYAEGEDGYRIETCAVCRGYVKTLILEKIGGSVVLPLEDAATLHLDVIAADSGYGIPSRSVPHTGVIGLGGPSARM